MREEVEVAPYVKSGSIDIDDPSVRDNINTLLHGITGRCFITPYIALERVAKVLNNFHIHVPKTTFLENDSGMVSFNISQFGNKFGMQNNGEVVVKNTSPFHLYFEYRMNEKGLFDVFCEILDETELEEIMSDLHDELNDSTDDDDETEEIETASDMRDRSLHEAAKDDTMKGMAAGLAAMAVLSEGKREGKAADAKAALMRAMERGAPDEEIAALTDRLRDASGVKKRVAVSAHRTNKDLEMMAKATAPGSKAVNE